MPGDERFQLANELSLAAELELGVDPLLDRSEAQLLEARDLALGEGVVGEIGERRSAPERERLGQRRRTRRRVAAVRSDGPLEAGEVELLGLDVEQVAGRARIQSLRREQLAQVGDIDLEGRPRRLRGALAPEAVDQRVAGNDLVRMQEENREQGALLAPTQGERAVALAHLQG